MVVTVHNQVPGHISPLYIPIPKGDYNPLKDIEEGLVNTLLQPIDPAIPVEVKENGNTVDRETIAKAIAATFEENVNPNAEETCKSLLEATMLYPRYVQPAPINWLFPAQAAAKLKLPLPSIQAHYMAQTDILPACKLFLAGQAGEDELLANFAFTYSPKTLGVFCRTEADFDGFKAYVAAQNTALGQILPKDTVSKLNEFCLLKLNSLSEGLDLRVEHGYDNDEYSFPRTIVWLLMHYVKNLKQTQSNMGIGLLPFHLSELYEPTSILFLNIDKHAHSTPKDIETEWDVITKALSAQLKIISKHQITKLGSTVRQHQRLQGLAKSFDKRADLAQKAINQKFSSKRPPVTAFIEHVKRKIEKMANVTRSQNTYKSEARSYLKPNRRNPMDTNLMGKTHRTNFRPDIHVYIDTSGSISESQYQDAVKACISLAKATQVDFYFNTFSHLVSTATQLKVKWRSVSDIYRDFQKAPKVTGGTDFANIWKYIQQSPKRRKELSIMITDFEYCAPNRMDIEHPKNLYYTACSGTNWEHLCKEAKNFVKSAKHLDPMIRSKVLF